MLTLYAVSAFAIATAAPPDSRTTAPQATGLVGTTWAMDCTRPPSAGNAYSDFTISSDGRLVETLRSPEGNGGRKIRNIQIISKNWLLYTLDDTDGEAVNILTFTDERGRKRTWWSVGNGGTVYVLNGKVADGSGLPWFTKCE